MEYLLQKGIDGIHRIKSHNAYNRMMGMRRQVKYLITQSNQMCGQRRMRQMRNHSATQTIQTNWKRMDWMQIHNQVYN